MYRVSGHAAVELLSDFGVEVPHVVERVEEGGHVEDLTEQKQEVFSSGKSHLTGRSELLSLGLVCVWRHTLA